MKGQDCEMERSLRVVPIVAAAANSSDGHMGDRDPCAFENA